MSRINEILALNTEEEMRAWVRDLTVPELHDVFLDIGKMFRCYAVMIDIVGLMTKLQQPAADWDCIICGCTNRAQSMGCWNCGWRKDVAAS